jgi:hypothetical protein
MSLSVTYPVTVGESEVAMKVAANRFVERDPEIVSLRVQASLDELVLLRVSDCIEVLILEHWGMGEKLDQIEQVIEHVPGGEIHFTNPRVASLEEVEPYRLAIDEIFSRLFFA